MTKEHLSSTEEQLLTEAAAARRVTIPGGSEAVILEKQVAQELFELCRQLYLKRGGRLSISDAHASIAGDIVLAMVAQGIVNVAS